MLDEIPDGSAMGAGRDFEPEQELIQFWLGGTDLAAHDTHFPSQPINFGRGTRQHRSTVNTAETLARKINPRGAR